MLISSPKLVSIQGIKHEGRSSPTPNPHQLWTWVVDDNKEPRVHIHYPSPIYPYLHLPFLYMRAGGRGK